MNEHGGNIYSFREKTGVNDVLDFSANISPLGVPESIKNAFVSSLDMLNCYPDPCNRKLVKAAADYHGISEKLIVCGNGGADVIYRTVRAIKPKKAVLFEPVFTEYSGALEEAGCTVTREVLPHPFDLNSEIIHRLENSDFDAAVLCNPNNPTGTLINPDILEKSAEIICRKNAFLILDECFLDMVSSDYEKYSFVSNLEKYRNTVIIKSLTKMFAVPGLRLGYGLCSDAELAEKIRSTGQPWSVSIPASECGATALGDTDYRRRFISFIAEEREYLCSELEKAGMEVWKPCANFVFFRAPGVNNLDRMLENYGIYIRSCSNYHGLNYEYYRVCVRCRNDNERLLKAVNELIRGNDTE